MSEEGTVGTSNGIHEKDSAEMSVYKKEACKVLTFQFVYDKDDLESDKIVSFKPEMAHQIFGESESIFGYRTLSITLNYLHNSCRCYLDIQSSGKINSDMIKADDIMKSLDPWLPANYTRSYDDFLEWTEEEEHDKIYGEVIKEFKDHTPLQRFPEDNITATYKITKNDTTDENFTDFHARFETFIMWFIDAANFIDLEDDRWLIFYVYEEFEHPIKKKIYRTPVAFSTVYKFYAYPSNIRARISQFFVLPTHQRRGIGTTLYETIAKTLRAMDEVVDITVEEPTASFLKIRDLEDCGIVYQELLERKLNYFSTSSKKIFEMGRKKKIGRRQIQRVYDILGLYYASLHGRNQYERVLEHIKKRISDENETDGNSKRYLAFHHSDDIPQIIKSSEEKAEIEMEFERHCGDIEPSAKYLEKESRPSKRFCNFNGAPPSIQVDKSAQIETDFKRHCDDIEPSVKYLEVKLKGWLQKNGYSE